MTKIKKRQAPQTKPAFSPLLIGGVIVISLLVVGGLMYLGSLQEEKAVVSFELDQFPTKGDPEAAVTIVEFSDYG